MALTHLGKDDKADPSARPLDLKLIVRLLGYTKRHARTRNAVFVLVIVRSIQIVLIAWALSWVIKGPLAAGDVPGTLLGAAIFGGLALATQITFAFRIRLAQQLGEDVVHDLRNDIFVHLQALPMGFYGRTKLGRIISRMTSDTNAVRTGVQDVLFVSIVQIGQSIGCAAFMLYYNWKLFLLVLGICPLLFAINRHYRPRLSEASRAIQASFSRVTATVAESVGGIRVTQGFVRQDVNASMFDELVADHSGYGMEQARLANAFVSLLDLNSQVFRAALLIVGAVFALRVGISNEEARQEALNLIPFFFMANLFFEPVNVIARQYAEAQTAMAGAERVFDFLDTRPEWVDDPDPIDLPRLGGRVEFRGVGFEYVPGKPVLTDISFIAQPGQTIALVGHSGGGKSSIINLIAKFYLPTTGQILIDDIDITRARTSSLHGHLGIVLQSNFLFSSSVMDNILMGRPGATEEGAIEAARKLDVLDLIAALPQGFQTPVGERGGNLSLGQRQVICFARAMMADPAIMILDEATSSVDAATEGRIQKALATLVRGRTSFIVAHRLSTIRHADLVLVLDHGRIVERGTHDQLLAAAGAYAQLYRRFTHASAASGDRR